MRKLLLILSIFTCSCIYSQSDTTKLDYYELFNLYDIDESYRPEALIDSLRCRYNITTNFTFSRSDNSNGVLTMIEIQSRTYPGLWRVYQTGFRLEERFQLKGYSLLD
jgi:hypothetical protein